MTILDLCAYVGLAAVGVITVNILLGILMVFRYSPVRSWPHRRLNYFRLHTWSGYVALFLSIAHPLILLLNKDPRFRIRDLAFPVHSPSQPLENTVGALALYLTAFLVITSYYRVQLGRRLWKAFHFSIYFTGAALFFHSLLTEPALKGVSAIDWLDGGKVFVEFCFLLVLVAGCLRYRRHRLKRTAALGRVDKTAVANFS